MFNREKLQVSEPGIMAEPTSWLARSQLSRVLAELNLWSLEVRFGGSVA
jgi:hypothetical protein